MGADKPQARKPDTDIQNTQTLFPLMLIDAVVLLVIIARFSTTDIKEGNEAPVLSPKEAAKLDKRLREIDDAEQYALIATVSGWYPCNHPGRTTFIFWQGKSGSMERLPKGSWAGTVTSILKK